MYNKDGESCKVFFITSNLKNIDETLEFRLEKSSGIYNLKTIYFGNLQYAGNDYSVRIFCFEFIKIIIKEKQKHSAIIKLKQKSETKLFRQTFEGPIEFIETKNNFIFDFKFENKTSILGWGIESPPLSKTMSHSEQLKLYIKLLENLNVDIYQNLSLDLIQDCKILLIESEKFKIDFFLEIFSFCYLNTPVKEILILFELEKVIPIYPIETNDFSKYSECLYKIEENTELISKYFSNENNQEKYYKAFYSLLLYFKYNYDRDKINALLSQKYLYVYYKEIIPFNYKIFKDIKIPQELIKEMTKQNLLSIQMIEGIIFYLKSFEKITIFINENIDCIFNLCIKENKSINISDLIDQKQEGYLETISNDNYEILSNEMEKLVNYELSKKQFVFIGNDFLNNYINVYSKNLKKLCLIKKIIQLLKKVDSKLGLEHIHEIIHKNALEMIAKGELKNEELLDFINNEDIFYNIKTYENLKHRPLEVFDGFDLDDDNELFYKKWNEVKIFEKYRFTNDFYIGEKRMIKKINHMKDFGKLLKLFNFDGHNYLCELISDKYKELLKTYNKYTCPNFLKDTSFLIIILEENKFEQNFLENTIKKDIESSELIIDIFLYLSSNYNISQNIIKYIGNYFLGNILNKNKIFLKGSIIIFLLNYFWKQTNDALNNYLIIENELYNEENNNIKFILLEELIKENVFDNLKDKTLYFLNTSNLSNKIYNDIINGNVKYDIIEPIFKNPERKQIFKQKLKTLLYLCCPNINFLIQNIEKNINDIKQNIENLNILDEVLCLFFEKKYINNIISIKNLKNEIIIGMINIINIKKPYINQLYSIIPDYKKIFQCKSSFIFLKLFYDNLFQKILKNNNSDILKESKNDYEQFKALFEEDWKIKLNKKFLNIIKEIDDDKIEKELYFMKNFFNLNINDLKITQLKNEIISFKNNTFYEKISNNSLAFIFLQK